ncbi:MAG TPA: mechanosensitive ion channel domain-containing protein [Flavobacteriaceae bacterium]|nr:mechanosensitive ion channel domain-containing protein [Flavobacteriaceae bacterium]
MDKNKKWITLYSIIGAITITIYYILQLDFFLKWGSLLPFLKKLSFSTFMLSAVLLIKHITIRLIETRVTNQGDQHNLLRVTNLIATSLLALILASIVIQEPLTTLYGIGIFSLILGFALQAPITSFIGWLYIIFRHPYQVGDRIEIKSHKGDVIEVSYLDTTILELSGNYLGNDRKSGRIIKIPNSTVLSNEVINYSGDQAPFIWNETPIQIAFTSDLKFVSQCLIEAATTDFEILYPSLVNESKEWEPTVYYRINSYAWLEAVVTYPVEPKDMTERRNRILRTALPMLNAQPEKVQFPEGAKR